jgi:polyhydroxybutyrate depolymerase
MRQVLKWAALVLCGTAVLAVAAYAYYWYSPPPQVPTLSSAIQRATLHVGDRDRTYLAYAPAQLAKGCAARHCPPWLGHGWRDDA